MAQLDSTLRQAIEEYVELIFGRLPDGLTNLDGIFGSTHKRQIIEELIEGELKRICSDAGVDFEDFKQWLGGRYNSLIRELEMIAEMNYRHYVMHNLKIKPEDIAQCREVGNEYECELREEFFELIRELLHDAVVEAVVSISDDIRYLLESYLLSEAGTQKH